MSTPVAVDTDRATLETFRVLLLNSANKFAAMRRLTKAYPCEIDRAVCGMPATGEPSRVGMIRQRGAAIASMLGAEHPVYATPMENLRAAQAAADELDHLEGDEHRYMTARLQQLLDTATAQQEAGCRVVEPSVQAENHPPLP